ncbi:hypothetical protein Tph_c10430 [Thermacetogenium phaeum DSM 12270]|uniref:Uncharacterized protein n=1 Tax=Thermacetogenium phaeum (strain ATCC BAA-254 / DSM 26808 / PB) TaxID=1089553 RepID=K4LDZ9_THEPS|nr:hypothetical protein [Thermacetogenium phaeum]AFV11266.1 hypothetical protein Tph_c10430 [Thermacetogenium phaeum DSM 12270]
MHIVRDAEGVFNRQAPADQKREGIYEGKTASIPVTVTAPVLERISVSPEQMNIAAGKTGQLLRPSTRTEPRKT